ncbi:phospholipase D-like domain-containing protein [Nitrosomonas communis]|uniref:Cardiolipin synthase n=1 Tax=Nitrosomonas communis TaxID=44574 RepID=A0A1I4X7R1_9PROT|nr:phospholipase D-like domain-containing protein [Nitrosomonas communis]SFN21476.1 cardiolipin synthase [Nitrosomonas communis]
MKFKSFYIGSAILTNWLLLHGLFAVIGLLVYVVATHVLQQRRHPSAAVGWVLFMMLLPYAALPLYLLFGTRKLTRSGRLRASAHAIPLNADRGVWPAEMAAALGQPRPANYRALCIHVDGTESLQALLQLIDGACNTLDVCSFILGRDTVGATILSHLTAKARSGVEVRLLLDGVGYMMGGRPDLLSFVQAGGRVGLFAPLLRFNLRSRTNLRNHRKLVIADAGCVQERLWCGGRNLAAHYFDAQPSSSSWHDLSFDLQGPLARQAADLFERDWAFAVRSEAPTANAKPIPLAVAAEASGQIIASGPDQADDTIHALLVSAGYRASRRIALVSPYVLLDDALLMALCLAVRRGVEVDLLLPARSNYFLADIARHRSLRALATARVRVWLAPQMLHAKAAFVDDVLALAGSANLDSRSLFLNYELMVALHDASDIARLCAWFERERHAADPYLVQPPGLWRDFIEGLVLWIGFQL